MNFSYYKISHDDMQQCILVYFYFLTEQAGEIEKMWGLSQQKKVRKGPSIYEVFAVIDFKNN